MLLLRPQTLKKTQYKILHSKILSTQNSSITLLREEVFFSMIKNPNLDLQQAIRTFWTPSKITFINHQARSLMLDKWIWWNNINSDICLIQKSVASI